MFCQQQYKNLLLVVICAFILGVSSVMAFYWQARDQAVFYQAQVQRLESEFDQSVKTLAKADVEAAIQRNAQYALRKSLDKQQKRLNEQERLLEFYSLLMSSGKSKEGLELNSYNLNLIDRDSRSYNLQFTFVQYAKKHRLLKANIKVKLLGSMEGQSRALDVTSLLLKSDGLSEESINTKKNVDNVKGFEKLRFKYFQKIEAQLTLPVGFKPEQVVIDADIKMKKAKPWQRVVSWQLEE